MRGREGNEGSVSRGEEREREKDNTTEGRETDREDWRGGRIFL